MSDAPARPQLPQALTWEFRNGAANRASNSNRDTRATQP